MKKYQFNEIDGIYDLEIDRIVKTIKRSKSKKVLAPKPDAPEVTVDTPKPNALQVWNSFVNTVKLEIFHSTGLEPSYNEYLKKAQEMKEADPESYKLFADNWSN